MTDHNTLGRTTRRLALLTTALFVAATGTATAHAGGGYSGGAMGGGTMGGGTGLWGVLWMGILIALVLALAYWLLDRGSGDGDADPRSVLRERYARGEISDEEFERRRDRLDRNG